MTFEALLDEVAKSSHGLVPETSKEQLAAVISPATKDRLIRLNHETAVKAILGAKEEINAGSVETVNALINKRISQAQITQ